MGLRNIATWMGLVDDGRYDRETNQEDEYTVDERYVEDEEELSEQLPAQVESRTRPRSVAAKEKKPSAAKESREKAVQQEREPEVADLSRIVSVRPRSYNEARMIGENFRQGVPVIMNLSDMEDGDDKRLVDFAAGLIFGLRGNIERVANKVFLLCPHGLVVGPEDRERISSGGFFNQS